MQAANSPPARQESTMDNSQNSSQNHSQTNTQNSQNNYNGLAAYHPHPSSQNAQGQPVYAYTPNQQAPNLPNPMQAPAPAGSLLSQTQQPPSGPPGISMIEGNRKFSLSVVQQPKRARMCGFGDKDRRPITPPPCIRLIVTDVATGIEIDLNDIDHSMYVLNVDLWNDQGNREVNLVRHSATSPSISATVPVSYYDQQTTAAYQDPFISGAFPYNQAPPSNSYAQTPPYQPYNQPPQVNPYAGHQSPAGHYTPQSGQPSPQQYPSYGQSNGSQGYPPPSPYQSDSNGPSSQGYYGSNQSPHYGQTGSSGQRASFSQPGPLAPDMALARLPVSQTAPTGMFTRNLIGSLAASAFRLTDPGDRMGIWFVLQDLSVRTEGSFRLRLSFVNVGPPSLTPNGNPANQNSILNTGRAPVLAACFSDVFTVYSAKKFPGVVESTALSKCFATQGIKIPIRKEAAGANGRKNDDGDFDE